MAKPNAQGISQPLGGSILLLTDTIDVALRDRIATEVNAQSMAVVMLLLGTQDGLVSEALASSLPQQNFAVDKSSIKSWAASAGIDVVDYSIDHQDVEAISRLVQQRFEVAQPKDQQQQDLDAGYYLLWPAILLMLLWFRRGMVMQWH